jgi:hypothetical protein
MEQDRLTARHDAAARQLSEHENRSDGDQVVDSLDRGLTVLADLLYSRLHKDVEEAEGLDSMLAPISPGTTQSRGLREINLYQVAESAAFARLSSYTRGDGSWYVQWLSGLRFAEPPQPDEIARIEDYLLKNAEQRRLAFTNVLARVVPESRRAPLVLFLLTPLAVHLATALAFGDSQRAAALRNQQVARLPAIDGCPLCRRRLLPNGAQCSHCGNPLWGFRWLTSSE